MNTYISGVQVKMSVRLSTVSERRNSSQFLSKRQNYRQTESFRSRQLVQVPPQGPQQNIKTHLLVTICSDCSVEQFVQLLISAFIIDSVQHPSWWESHREWVRERI